MGAKRTELLRWMLRKKVFKTSDIIYWGCENFSNRADRNARDFAEKPLELIRRLSKFELKCKGIESKEGYYIADEEKIREYLQPKLF